MHSTFVASQCFDYTFFPLSQILLFHHAASSGAAGAGLGRAESVHELALQCVAALLDRIYDGGAVSTTRFGL